MPKPILDNKYRVVQSPITNATRTYLFKNGAMIAVFTGKNHTADCQKVCDLLNEVPRSQGKVLKLSGKMISIPIEEYNGQGYGK